MDIEDIHTMAAAWLTEEGEGGFNANADLSFDGKTDNVDSDILSENWLTGGSWAAQHYYFHYDGLGSVIALTDSAGNTIETYAYDVYGSAIVRDTHDAILNTSSVGNPYFFTGRRFDTETELYYYRARYYSPIIGRFLQTDPIGYLDAANLYIYVGNNPIILIDPFGLCTEEPYDYDRVDEKPLVAWHQPGKTPPSSWPGPGKGWKWDPRGYLKKRGERKHWHRPDPKHGRRGHWDVEDRKGRKIRKEYTGITTRALTAVGVAGRAVGKGLTAVGEGLIASGEWAVQHPYETVLIVGGSAIVAVDVATFPSGEGGFGVLLIRQAITSGP